METPGRAQAIPTCAIRIPPASSRTGSACERRDHRAATPAHALPEPPFTVAARGPDRGKSHTRWPLAVSAPGARASVRQLRRGHAGAVDGKVRSGCSMFDAAGFVRETRIGSQAGSMHVPTERSRNALSNPRLRDRCRSRTATSARSAGRSSGPPGEAAPAGSTRGSPAP
ncbi:hypothetical protein TVNIR_3697 [Thioalkalivibrio nitratireducens DSM 14787]|uniref:Uncharacterized protein n=1 Tax=Thioalkalivibrio nitratireducens (strain DSM 14787 / UNIQEM 213 / ALEN2) TaxID=1255043 RepID=L0E281_THIND|nr:hypothetical protein TVNIR_3697 [Thioalkalivibrio nitratireducens DSM 14787]